MPRFSTVVVCTSPRRPVLIPMNTFGGAERLLKDDFARVPFLSSSPLAPSALRAFETSFSPGVGPPLSQLPAISGRTGSEAHQVPDRYPRGGPSPVSVQMAPLILDSNIQIQRGWLSRFECRVHTRRICDRSQ